MMPKMFVDALELEVLGAALSTYDYAQIPVIPLMAPRARWVGRHYCDEFAESHGKELPVRSAIGAPLPTAGVGCAFRVEALKMLDTGGGPFSADCLTEDYELGVRLGRIGKRGTFVRRFDHAGQLIASRALFPMRIDDSVRQKTRWLRGIALDGWDRLGWTIGRSKLGSLDARRLDAVARPPCRIGSDGSCKRLCRAVHWSDRLGERGIRTRDPSMGSLAHADKLGTIGVATGHAWLANGETLWPC